MRSFITLLALVGLSTAGPVQQRQSSSCSFWMEDIKHQGVASFNTNPSGYQVFRNVKDFGAKGDGSTDDTAAIQSAMSSGDRCAPGSCNSITTSPAVVYFPAGTYLISAPIVDYYYTQMIGNPVCLPTIKASSAFKVAGGQLAMIEDDPYSTATGNADWASVNIFNRQIRNFIIDTTAVAASSAVTGIHWATAQATSLQNIVFQMSSASGTQHQGIFMESGSAGFATDLTFNGGLVGAAFGNQQMTLRNATFNGCVTAIEQIWDWTWTYSGLSINNCQTGINMSSGGVSDQAVGSVTIFDSSFSNTPTGIITAYNSNSSPVAAESLILENVKLSNVHAAVQGPNGVALAGGSTTISAWGEGHAYTPSGPNQFEGAFTANTRPSALTVGGNFYTRSKPQYAGQPASNFLSARDAGAKGDGKTDDTQALQSAIDTATSQNKILYLDHGNYRVTDTITVPAGAKIIGETYSVILASGDVFSHMESPLPVLQIGKVGNTGSVELSDFIVATQGPTAGAILIEYNLASPAGSPSGLWDVHTRIGGFAGSNLQTAQCEKTPGSPTINSKCIAAFMSMHVTTASSGLYMENNWLWTADHDIDDPALTQIDIYTGRGLLIESSGPVWLYGHAVEHHSLYQYQFTNAKNILGGVIQTETAYYQPNPAAPTPYASSSMCDDPVFSQGASGWGLRIVNSSDILLYGVGLYSFFQDWDTTCSSPNSTTTCQQQILSLEGALSEINVYNLNTVRTADMVVRDGQVVAKASDNANSYSDTIARLCVS